MDNETELGIYRSSCYFQDDFPFCIERITHERRHFTGRRFHRREFWKISCILNGSGAWLFGDESYRIGPGSLIFSHPNACTTYRIDSPELELYNILFMPSLWDDLALPFDDGCNFFQILKPEQPDSILLYIQSCDRFMREIIRNLEIEYARMAANRSLMIRLQLAELLLRMARQGVGKLKKGNTIHAVEIISQVIKHNFREEINLETIAGRTGLSRSRLCQLFRAATGQTIMGALRRRRLEEACDLLKNTDCSIIEISGKSGFGDLSTFNRSFGREIGMQPANFRKKYAKI